MPGTPTIPGVLHAGGVSGGNSNLYECSGVKMVQKRRERLLVASVLVGEGDLEKLTLETMSEHSAPYRRSNLSDMTSYTGPSL